MAPKMVGDGLEGVPVGHVRLSCSGRQGGAVLTLLASRQLRERGACGLPLHPWVFPYALLGLEPIPLLGKEVLTAQHDLPLVPSGGLSFFRKPSATNCP